MNKILRYIGIYDVISKVKCILLGRERKSNLICFDVSLSSKVEKKHILSRENKSKKVFGFFGTVNLRFFFQKETLTL